MISGYDLNAGQDHDPLQALVIPRTVVDDVTQAQVALRHVTDGGFEGLQRRQIRVNVAENCHDHDDAAKVARPDRSDIGAYPHAAAAFATDTAGKRVGAWPSAGRIRTGDEEPNTVLAACARSSSVVAHPDPTL